VWGLERSIYDPVKVRNAVRIMKELLAAHGHPNAVIEPSTEEVSGTSTAITFKVNEGDRVRVSKLPSKATRFSAMAARSQMKYVREAA